MVCGGGGGGGGVVVCGVCVCVCLCVCVCVPGQLVGYSAGPMIERLRVQIPAGAVGEFSSPESTLCADSYSVSVPPLCYCSGT